jgi:hypothetical protein
MLKSTNIRLKASLHESHLLRSPTQTECQTAAIAAECVEAANQVLDTLGNLNSDSKPSRFRKIVEGLKAVWNNEKFESLQNRLKGLREQLMLVVLLGLQ